MGHIHAVSDDDTSVGSGSVSVLSASTASGVSATTATTGASVSAATPATAGSVSSLTPVAAAVKERRASYRDNSSVTSKQQLFASRRRTMSEMSDASLLSCDSSAFDAASIIGR